MNPSKSIILIITSTNERNLHHRFRYRMLRGAQKETNRDTKHKTTSSEASLRAEWADPRIMTSEALLSAALSCFNEKLR